MEMTEKELENLIEAKYGAFPDDEKVMSKNHFDSEADWDDYCQKTIDLLNSNVSKADFFAFFGAPFLWCNVPLPSDG